MLTATVTISAPNRGVPGWDTIPTTTYPVQSFNGTMSWGEEPGEFNLVYVTGDPVYLGAAVTVSIGQYFFSGTCEKDVPLVSTRGNTRQLTFKDYRKWLKWDKAYCLLNHVEDTLVNGVRKRRYWHILPNDFYRMRKTWTTNPYSAAQIISLVLTGPGIETPWTIGYLDSNATLHQGNFHPNTSAAILEVDCLNGKPLATLLSEICEQLGLLFTLAPDPQHIFNLVFAQKGFDGPNVAMPADSDFQESGVELSGNPTRIRVLGDRNLYQVHDINLVPDWNTQWTTRGLYDTQRLVEYVFQHCITWDQANDPEQIVARQQARALALEITVAQLDASLGAGGSMLDYRKYGGKCRNELPAAFYIENILFRCFRLPNNFSFTNTYGNVLDVNCVEPVDKLLTSVTHDPVTGAMVPDTTTPTSGNCYVISQGYQVGKDMFESIRPERFDLNAWTSSQNIWQKIEARIQDEGDSTGPVIVFDEPVINSSDLVRLVDGYIVFNAVGSIQSPSVKATLTFAGEKFSWFQQDIGDPSSPPQDPVMGTQIYDEVLNAGGLCGEFIVRNGLTEIPYADGQTCRYKAIERANNVLKFQWTHARGQFTQPMSESFAWKLHGKIDRIGVQYGPDGYKVQVSLTSEFSRWHFVPERDLERLEQLRVMLPGERELRKQAQFALKIAATAKSSKDAYKMLADAFYGNFMETANAQQTVVMPSIAGAIPIGSVFVKEPNVVVNGKATKTRSQNQAETQTQTFTEFAGVSTRHSESIHSMYGAEIPLQKTGYALARVLGPVAAGDTIGIQLSGGSANTQSALMGSGHDIAVGTACQSIGAATVALIRVNLGQGGGSDGGFPVWL